MQLVHVGSDNTRLFFLQQSPPSYLQKAMLVIPSQIPSFTQSGAEQNADKKKVKKH